MLFISNGYHMPAPRIAYFFGLHLSQTVYFCLQSAESMTCPSTHLYLLLSRKYLYAPQLKQVCLLGETSLSIVMKPSASISFMCSLFLQTGDGSYHKLLS